jgi:hypothetical protein
MISEKGETFLWYFPDGAHSTIETSTSPDATPTDGWGSSAMLFAFIEGLAGVHDIMKELKHIRLTPRWEAAGVTKAEVMIGYPSSSAYVKYNYFGSSESVILEIEGSSEIIDLELLLPQGKKYVSSNASGGELKMTRKQKPEDKYFRCSIKKLSDSIKLTIILSLG